MRIWQITSDAKAESFRHRFAGGGGHALLSQIVRGAFALLRVSASICEAHYWWVLHSAPSVVAFESEHGVETERQVYNQRMLQAVGRRKKALRGEHAGYSDWFVPITIGEQVAAILVVGPFLLERLTSSAILERWWKLSSRKGDLTDPEFRSYLNRSLSTLVLEGELGSKFEQLLHCYAGLLAGEGKADELANRADGLRVALESVRRVETTWEVVQAMVDERSTRTWAGVHAAYTLSTLGLPRPADHIAVGLALSRAKISDPVDDVVRQNAFQREAIVLARSFGGAIAGRIEDRGIILFSAGTGSRENKRQKLFDLIERARLVARREFDLALHFGVSAAPSTLPLSRSYQAALAASESALARGQRLVLAEEESTPEPDLRTLRRELTRALGERPGVLRARFDRYLDAVVARSGDRMEPARAHLEAGFDGLADALLDAASLDQKSFDLLSAALDRASAGARNVHDLSSAYRQAAADLSAAIERPVQSRQDRSLRGALDHVHQHFTERLSFQRVARLSGFAPKYFSALFKERQNKTFEAYVLGLRLERGKHLLSATDFSVVNVARLSGFGSSHYFCRVFRRETGKSPLEFRRLRVYPTTSQKTRRARGLRGR